MKRFAFPFFSVLMLGVCSLALASCGSAASDSASDRRMMALYDSIDVEMKRSEDYRAEKERRIDMLRDELARETDVERRKRITDRLISEFESYNSDSALHYVNANLASPAVARDDHARTSLLIKKADITSHAGLFADALSIMSSLNSADMDSL